MNLRTPFPELSSNEGFTDKHPADEKHNSSFSFTPWKNNLLYIGCIKTNYELTIEAHSSSLLATKRN